LQSTYTVCESGTAGPTGGTTRNRTPGYVALAVATEKGDVFTREVETGVGKGVEGGREANMVAFGKAALELLRDVINGEAGEPTEKL
jgi:nicotinamide mononucleotide (NMN) deamidase PncC